MVRRVYVEKKAGLRQEADSLCRELRSVLGVTNLTGVRVVNRYDVEGLDEAAFDDPERPGFDEELSDEERSSLLNDSGYYVDGNSETGEEFYVNEKRSCYIKYYDADGNVLQNNAEYYGITDFEDHRPYFYTIATYDYSDVESAYKGLVSDFMTTVDTHAFEAGNDILAIVESPSKKQYLVLGLKSTSSDKQFIFIDVYPEDALEAGAFNKGENGFTPTEVFEAISGHAPNA